MLALFTIPVNATQSGKASYYADRFDGRKTANGETFRNSKLTAASNKLKFGTHVRVTNVENGKSVVVKINDTGKFGKGVIIDLSQSAFKRIAPLTRGIVKVRVTIVK